MNLVDASGNPVASYAYDTWGNLTSASESFANGWSNPYRYDGRDGVRYDAVDGLYWMRVRAYNPTIGRFISHDPLGRAPLFFADQPYAYVGANPVSNVDPSGQRYTTGNGGGDSQQKHYSPKKTRTKTRKGSPKKYRKTIPFSLLKGCSLCSAIVDTLAKTQPTIIIGAILIAVGVVADAIAIGMFMKAGLENPELAPMILHVLAILGSMSLALDVLSGATAIWGSGPIAGIIHGLLALINFMASALKVAVPIALAGGWAAALLRIGLAGTVEAEEGEAAPIDAAVSIFIGLQVAGWISVGASFLIGVGEALVAWGNLNS